MGGTSAIRRLTQNLCPTDLTCASKSKPYSPVVAKPTMARLKSGGASKDVERAVRMIAGLFVLLSLPWLLGIALLVPVRGAQSVSVGVH
jgi:hypothetical protein